MDAKASLILKIASINMKSKIRMTKGTNKKIPVTVKKGSVDVLNRLAFLNKNQPHAVLATVSADKPHTSLIAYAVTPDLKGLIFATPLNTRKYRNIMKNNNVSLLIDSRSNTAKDYMNAESITITGKASIKKKGKKKDVLAGILIRKHPRLKKFIDAPSTALILIKTIKCIHVSSFQVVSEYAWRATHDS